MVHHELWESRGRKCVWPSWDPTYQMSGLISSITYFPTSFTTPSNHELVLAGPVAWTGKRSQLSTGLDWTRKGLDSRSSLLQLLEVEVAVASNQGGPKYQLQLVFLGWYNLGAKMCILVIFSRFLILCKVTTYQTSSV